MKTIYVLLFSYLLQSVLSQTLTIPNPQVNTSNNGLVWFLLVMIFTFIYAVPIMAWFYRVVIQKLIEKAQKRIETLTVRLSERFSAAGRKLSEQMRA